MPDPVWPLAPDERPLLLLYNGVGYALMHNTRPDAGGGFFATRWRMFWLPIFPLGRYYVRQGATGTRGNVETTEYTLVGRSRLRLPEVLRTYLLFWVGFPGSILGPIFVTAWWTQDEQDPTPHMFVAMAVGLVAVAALATAFLLYRARWRPIRQAHWEEPQPDDH